MNRVPLHRAGLTAAVALLVLAGATAPAYAQDAGEINGRLTTADGTPIAFASVTVYNPAFEFAGAATTDEAGDYTITDVQPGDYKIEFRRNLLVQWAHDKVDFETADVFALGPGATLRVDESWLPTGTITGRFTDAHGDPVASGTVNGYELDRGALASVNTDGDGRYVLELPPGSYQIGSNFPEGGITQWAPSSSARRRPGCSR